MTCQERVELMQRYLDHDLSDAEQHELMEHLQQCAECSGLFERLRLLDSELSQLPKVTPAFSLVDAILPQLTELERLPGKLEETAAKEPAAAAPAGGIPRTRRVAASWKMAGGIAVAAAMIGIFIMKEQNLLTPSVALRSGAAESGKAADTRPAAGAAANAGGGAAKKDSGPGTNASMPALDLKAPNPNADKSSSKAPAPASAQSSDGQSPAQQPKKPAGQTALDNNRVAISSSRNEPAPGTEGDQKPATMSAAGGASGEANPAGPAAAPNGASNSAADANTGTQPESAPHLKGIAASPQQNGQYSTFATPAPAPVTLKSPDGKLIASIENLKVVVRQTDTGATVTASTYSWSESDVISLVGFSEDGKLTYHVQHQSGADDITIDTVTKTETKTATAKK